MVVEHSFVTTMDETQALDAAAAFLQERGFARAVLPNARGLELQRGKKNSARAKSVSELPQVVRVDFDRGRVSVGISVTPSARWGGQSFTNSQVEVTQKDVQNPKRMKLHHDMALGIATGLEQLLVNGLAADQAARDWNEAEERIAAAARRFKRMQLIGTIIIFAVIVVIFGIIIYVAR